MSELATVASFEFLVIRHNIKKYLPDSVLSVLDKKFLYPLVHFDKSSLSMTDQATPLEQIRFFQAERSARSVSRLAKKMAQYISETIVLELSMPFGPLVQAFIQALLRMGCTPQITTLTRLNDMSADEQQLAIELLKGQSGCCSLIEHCLQHIVNAGDMFTGEQLLDHLLIHFPEFEQRAADRIGLVKICVHKPFEAGYYYQALWSQGTPRAQVKAAYLLAMLYLRHHQKNRQNFARGKQYLLDGYAIIASGGLKELDAENRLLHAISNRNGYALVLYREGQLQAAVELLENAVSQLGVCHGKPLMLKSATLYNLCQCYRALGDHEVILESYQKLLAIDNASPEYHLELALYHQGRQDNLAAVDEMQQALHYDPLHSDTLYHYSQLLLEMQGDRTDYLHCAQTAWEIAGTEITAYNYAYALALQGEYDQLEALRPALTSSYYPQWLILRSEGDLTADPQQSKQLLQEALTIWPDNPLLIENFHCLQQLLS
jgi:tetratricopeptide (TPR) repeat protein